MLKNISLSIFAMGFFCLVASKAYADPNWSQQFYIQNISHVNLVSGSDPHGVWLMPVAGATIYNDNCPASPVSYFLPDEGYTPGNPTFKTDLALVVQAFMSGRPIKVFVKGCRSGSTNNPLVTGIEAD